jgi:hypothetical protein
MKPLPYPTHHLKEDSGRLMGTNGKCLLLAHLGCNSKVVAQLPRMHHVPC